MIVDDQNAVGAMKRLANPGDGNPAVVAGESGGVGLARLLKVAADPSLRGQIALGPDARVFLINTEDATDPGVY
ncbi:threonine dehydratase [Bradyrhizobium sp. JR1.5]